MCNENTKLRIIYNLFIKDLINLYNAEVKKLKNPLKLFLNSLISFFVIFFFCQTVYGQVVEDSFKNSYMPPTSTNDQNVSSKVIYLTFDDGPSVITNKILDILKERDVKATFFLIGNQIKGFEDTVERINKEGHSIGLHTYSHKYKRIYKNSDAFIKEMLDCRNEVNRTTGTNPNIIRFPGGSRKILNDEFLTKLHKNNFKIYDWNIQISDGINPKTSPKKLFREATKNTTSTFPIILLMHCDYMHKNTCEALPRIIEYYKQQGYEFKTITEATPEFYFLPTKKTLRIFLI